MLGRIVERKKDIDEEIKQMTWEQKIRFDTKRSSHFARNFEHMVQLFIRDVSKWSVMPIGEIADYFYTVEF